MSNATATSPRARIPSTFTPEARSLIREAEDHGWTFTMSTKGHAIGKAPDGVTTMSVSRRLNGRAGDNARAPYKRWLALQLPPPLTVYDPITPTPADELDDVVARGQARRDQQPPAPSFSEEPPVAEPTLKPWRAKKQPGRLAGATYNSAAVLERTWPSGQVDYVCAFPGCEFFAVKPRSVSSHYGPTHTARGEGVDYREATKVLIPDASYTEPTSTRDYHPSERLIQALIAALQAADAVTDRDIAITALTWLKTRPDLPDAEALPTKPLEPEDILERIRMLVGQPLAVEVEALNGQVTNLTTQLTQRTAERDEVTARMMRVEQDLSAVREMLGAVGGR